MILRLLAGNEKGLQNREIVNRLRELPWFQVAVSKDLVKVDLEEMERDGKIQKDSERRWTLNS